MTPPTIRGAGVALLAALVLPALAEPPPTDPSALLKELAAIQSRQQQGSHQRLGRLAKELMDASRSDQGAEKVFVEAVRNTDFDSRSGDAGRFQDWRKNRKGQDSKIFLAALRFHLRYVAISLLEVSKARPEDLPPVPELVAYVTDYVSARAENPSGQWHDDIVKELLEAPIADGKIARANLIQPELQKLCAANGGGAVWEPMAGAWEKILETDVRAPLRAKKDPRLLETWIFQMKAGEKLLQNDRADLAKANFDQVELPRLRWGHARDLRALGQEAGAITQMAQVVRAYPQHPDVPAWVEELTGLLKPKAAPAAGTPPPAGP